MTNVNQIAGFGAMAVGFIGYLLVMGLLMQPTFVEIEAMTGWRFRFSGCWRQPWPQSWLGARTLPGVTTGNWVKFRTAWASRGPFRVEMAEPDVVMSLVAAVPPQYLCCHGI